MRTATESERASISEHIDPKWALRVEAGEPFPIALLQHFFWSSDDDCVILEASRDGKTLNLHTTDLERFDLRQDIDDGYICYSAELRTLYVKSAGWIHAGGAE